MQSEVPHIFIELGDKFKERWKKKSTQGTRKALCKHN